MMKKLSKILAIVLAIASLTVLIAGCGSNNSNNNSNTDSKNEYENQDDVVQPQSITLSKTSLDMYVGDTYQLYAIISPASASQDITWSSVNTSCVTVSDSGVINCVAAGTAVIKATTKNNLVSACTVNVSKAVGTVSGTITYKYKISSSATDYKDSGTTIQLISKSITSFPDNYNLVSNFDCGIYTMETDSDGKYNFEDIPAGEYLIILKSGHANESTDEMAKLLYGTDYGKIERLYGDLFNLLDRFKDMKFNGSDTITYYDYIVNNFLNKQAKSTSITVETNKTTTKNDVFYAIYN